MSWLHRFRLVALCVPVALALIACGQGGALGDDPIGSLLPSSSTGLGSESPSPSQTAEPDPDRPGFNRWYAASGVFAVSLPVDCASFSQPDTDPESGLGCATYDADNAPDAFQPSDYMIQVGPNGSECCPEDGRQRTPIEVDGMTGWYRITAQESGDEVTEDGFKFRVIAALTLREPIRWGRRGRGISDIMFIVFRAGGDTQENRRIAMEVIRSVEVFER